MKKFFISTIKWLKSHAIEIFILLVGFFFGSLAIAYLVKNLFIAIYLGAIWGAFATYIMIRVRQKASDGKTPNHS